MRSILGGDCLILCNQIAFYAKNEASLVVYEEKVAKLPKKLCKVYTMQIKRNYYLQQLIDGKKNGLIKIITGIRRCGKSYLLFTLFRQHLIASGVPDDHIIRIALDDIENEELRAPLVLYKNIKARMIDDELYYILLDEVQLVPRFEEVLNSLLRIDNADVYAQFK